MAPEKLDRLKLLYIGFVLGLGTPFLIAGMVMQLTGTRMAIAIVEK